MEKKKNFSCTMCHHKIKQVNVKVHPVLGVVVCKVCCINLLHYDLYV